MKRMSFSVTNVSRGAHSPVCDSQWLRFMPRLMTKPDGFAGALEPIQAKAKNAAMAARCSRRSVMELRGGFIGRN